MTRSPPGDRHWYQVSGWTIAADRPLPFLVRAAPIPDPEVTVSFGAWPEVATTDTDRFQIHAPDLVDLSGPAGVRIRIAEGRRLIVDAPEGADGTAHALLFGAAFAVLGFQRGSVSLHAGAVVSRGAALAIAGHSGAGKSTITRALTMRDLPMLADDQLRIDPAPATAYPGFPANKLWADSAAWLNAVADPALRVVPGIEKFHVAAPGHFQDQPEPLGAVFALAPTPDLAGPDVVRLSRAEAVATLGSLIHYRHVGVRLGLEGVMFQWAHQLARTTPVFLVRRPHDLASLRAVVDAVEAAYEDLRAGEAA